jgi:ActR/RegA family two-component response regulator
MGINKKENQMQQTPHDIAIRAYNNAVYAKNKLSAAEYMLKYPQVYQAFERFAHEALRSGRKKIGAKMLAERVRWESFIQGHDDWKVNNTYVSAMARRFMNENPLYGQVFETRKTKEVK